MCLAAKLQDNQRPHFEIYVWAPTRSFIHLSSSIPIPITRRHARARVCFLWGIWRVDVYCVCGSDVCVFWPILTHSWCPYARLFRPFYTLNFGFMCCFAFWWLLFFRHSNCRYYSEFRLVILVFAHCSLSPGLCVDRTHAHVHEHNSSELKYDIIAPAVIVHSSNVLCSCCLLLPLLIMFVCRLR